MKAKSILFLGAVVGSVFAQDAFEPLSFNVTEALIENGVDISALPELAGLIEKRSLFSPCAVAVSAVLSRTFRMLTPRKVQLSQAPLPEKNPRQQIGRL